MASTTEIANLVLNHCAVGKTISNLETEQSEAARAIRRVYDIALDVTLRDFAWPFATKIAALALVAEEPNTEWGYSYRYPSDCLEMRRILSGVRNDTRQSRAPYKIAQDSAGLLIFTDEEDAQAEYTVRMTDPQRYPADFTLALSFYIAAIAAPTLTAGDQFKLGDRAGKMYAFEIARATTRGFNEEQPEELPEAEAIRARE